MRFQSSTKEVPNSWNCSHVAKKEEKRDQFNTINGLNRVERLRNIQVFMVFSKWPSGEQLHDILMNMYAI
jgi:hypothetical protein